MPMLPNQWNNDVSKVSLYPSNIPEYVIPLWWNMSGSPSTNVLSDNACLQKGSLSQITNTSVAYARCRLHKLNKWPPKTTFALEAVLQGTGSYAAVCQLVDLTSAPPVFVTGATMSSTSSSKEVKRTSTFTLTEGKWYGVRVYSTGGTSGTVTIGDVSLIAFPQ